MIRLPTRRAGLVTRSVGSETVVYDGKTGEAHLLTPLATSVYELCDGTTSVEDAAGLLGSTKGDVEAAAVTLTSAGLVDAEGMTRRSAMARIGLIGGGALVTTLALPMAAAHASGPGGGGGTPVTRGNALVDRSAVDTFQNFTMWDTSLLIPANATVTQFQGYASALGPTGSSISFVIVDQSNKVLFVGAPLVPTHGAPFTYNPAIPPVLAVAGFPGWYVVTDGVIPCDVVAVGDHMVCTNNGDGPPSVGQTLVVGFPDLERFYSFNVTYTP
jgi:hypothetical protein